MLLVQTYTFERLPYCLAFSLLKNYCFTNKILIYESNGAKHNH